jgi:hypothetical protein
MDSLDEPEAQNAGGSDPAVIHSLRPGSRDRNSATRQVRRSWALAAIGAAVTAVPGSPGLVLAIAGNPHAPALLISSGFVGAATIMATGAVRIYETSQRTRRLQLQLEGSTAIARAVARCIDDSHIGAQDLPAGQQASEVANMRASAQNVLLELMPAVLAAICQRQPSDVGLDEARQRTRRRPPSNIKKPA